MSKTHVIDGVTYVEVDRKAKVGDLAFVFDHSTGYPGANGIHKVDDVEFDGHIHYGSFGRRPGGYRVLEPIEANPDVTDLLANLARRVHSLEQQLRDTQRNLETFAEQTESNTQDIAMLDERTQPKEEATVEPDESIPKYWSELVLKIYGGARR
jgi:hypothetical protein